MNSIRIHQVGSKSKWRGGFTLVEVLVVIVIAMILLTISVPAFQSLIDSSERSLAVNSLQAGVQAAQDIALASREGEDGAIVFLIADNGRLTMVPAVKIGTHREPYTDTPGPMGLSLADYDYIEMEVFAPLSSGETIQLPLHWNVRGYASINSMLDQIVIHSNSTVDDRKRAIWYDSPHYGSDNKFANEKTQGNWVFPETATYAMDAQYAGGNISGDLGVPPEDRRTPRQSFMIRFNGRTGQLSRSMAPALLISPRLSRERPGGDRPGTNDRWKRVDLADNVHRWARRVLETADVDGNGNQWSLEDQLQRSSILGNASHDTVLVKAVSRIALYNEAEMARDLGARGLNRITGTIYDDYDQTNSNSDIAFDFDLWPTSPPSNDELRVAINRWIEGDTNGDGVISFDPVDPVDLDQPLSRLYLINPYSGKLQEVIR